MVILCGRLQVVIVEANGLPNLDQKSIRSADKSDPYCIVEVRGATGKYRIGKTFTIDDCLNPRWYYKLISDLSQDVSGINFTVKDRDLLSSEVIGTCFVPVEYFCKGTTFEGKLSLTSPKGGFAGTLTVSLLYTGTSTSSDSTDIGYRERAKLKADEIKNRMSRRSFGNNSHSFSSKDMTTFLHGALDIHIENASGLPNLDSSILSFQKKDVSDPYVIVNLEDIEGGLWKVATTRVIDNNLNPYWDENFRVDVCHKIVSITFVVRDKDFLSSEIIGSVSFSANELLNSNGVDGEFDLFRDKSGKKAGKIRLAIKYTNIAIAVTPEVPECLYPMRCNNKVTLFQDAHCPSLPIQLHFSSGEPYVPKSTWREIHYTLINAQKLIYIVGWSVSAKISLLRWEGEDMRSLGDILLQKSKEGVIVRLLLWDELTSNEFKKSGAMSTEDEETATFFKGSNVQVILAPRDRHTKDMFSTKNPFTKLCYTHHQKVVIADSISADGHSILVSFVGGLDLTGGRFDTPEHHLFKTLPYEHSCDFRNRMFQSSSSCGPREPWHDIHSKVEGPIAYDLLANFEERWLKQGLKDERLPSVLHLNLDVHYCHSSVNSWNVQMFRSINSDSATFNWQSAATLSNKKGRAFDNSLHRAYIHHIRRSRHFIYIENQYFLGSSHEWIDCKDAKAGNLVPLEIATHIEKKISLGERFVAYIVVPMFPEGKPNDKVTQEILHWQFRTMEMMYNRVACAISSAGLDTHPQDYLLFLCLGRKEPPDIVPEVLSPPEDPVGASAFHSRRMMIYVHSKMAIFDDEYIIVGSANINDRSLSGNRDTEIAIGAYQPNFMSTDDYTPRGEVSLFRKCLWAEHMGNNAPFGLAPQSVDCARAIKQIAEEGLIAYVDSQFVSTPHHLLLYPITVESDGTLNAYSSCPNIPDTTASIIGTRSKVIPSSLTT